MLEAWAGYVAWDRVFMGRRPAREMSMRGGKITTTTALFAPVQRAPKKEVVVVVTFPVPNLTKMTTTTAFFSAC